AALAQLVAGLGAGPDDVAAGRGAALARLRLGSQQDGLEGLRRAAARAPADAEILEQLARAELAAGELDAAGRTLERALSLAPGGAALLVLRGDLLLRRKRPLEAVDVLERARYLSPD